MQDPSTLSSPPEAQKKSVVVWVDGCFDLFHFGHANFLRKAKALGDKLIVGVHSDAEITKHKGPPVMKEHERYEAVRACKWVDQVVEDAPYDTQVEWLDRFGCDFCVHGDDIVLDANGVDTYAAVKAANRFRTVTRTTGVSTTDIVGRLLLVTRQQHQTNTDQVAHDVTATVGPNAPDTPKRSPYTGVSRYLPSTNRLAQFAAGSRVPLPTDRIVYSDGGWDLFHLGHVKVLEQARALGDYLIVGVHGDDVLKEAYGPNLPIMNLHERVLSVLACRYVDEVIIGAPYALTEEMIRDMHISCVVHGTTWEPEAAAAAAESDPYAAAKRLGVYHEVPSFPGLTTDTIRQRIIENRRLYEERNRKKEAKELASLPFSDQQKQQWAADPRVARDA